MTPGKEETNKAAPQQKDKIIRDDKTNGLRLDDGKESDRHKSDRNKEKRHDKGAGQQDETSDMNALTQHTPRSPSTPSSNKKRSRTDEEQGGHSNNRVGATTDRKIMPPSSPSKKRPTHEEAGMKDAEPKSPAKKMATPVTSKNAPHPALPDAREGEATKEALEASSAAKSKKKSPQSLSGYNM